MTAGRQVQARPFLGIDRPVDPSTMQAARRSLNVRLSVGDGNDVALGHASRPAWRGRVHVIALVAAVPAISALLVISTRDARFQVGLAAYAVGLCTMFGASAT